MKPKTYSSKAIVLAKQNYSETDRIIILLTSSWGKLSVVAKGVRRPESKKRGALEMFNKINFSAVRGKNLDIITEAEIIDTYEKIRESLPKVTVAYFFVETIGRIIREGETNEELFTLLDRYLHMLEKTHKLKTFRNEFIYHTLITLGYWSKHVPMKNPDFVLEDVLERKLNSVRVGKKLIA